MGAGKWPLILKLEHNIWIWSGRIFDICPSFCVTWLWTWPKPQWWLSKKNFFRSQWNLVRSYRSMSDARRYAVWPEPRSRSRSLKGSRPSVPHGTNFLWLCFRLIASPCRIQQTVHTVTLLEYKSRNCVTDQLTMHIVQCTNIYLTDYRSI